MSLDDRRLAALSIVAVLGLVWAVVASLPPSPPTDRYLVRAFDAGAIVLAADQERLGVDTINPNDGWNASSGRDSASAVYVTLDKADRAVTADAQIVDGRVLVRLRSMTNGAIVDQEFLTLDDSDRVDDETLAMIDNTAPADGATSETQPADLEPAENPEETTTPDETTAAPATTKPPEPSSTTTAVLTTSTAPATTTTLRPTTTVAPATTTRAPATTTTRPTTTTTQPTTTTTIGNSSAQSWFDASDAGAIEVRCENGAVQFLRGWRYSDWSADVEDRGPSQVAVSFYGNDRHVRIVVTASPSCDWKVSVSG